MSREEGALLVRTNTTFPSFVDAFRSLTPSGVRTSVYCERDFFGGQGYRELTGATQGETQRNH